MNYKDSLNLSTEEQIDSNHIFSKEIDEYFSSLGFYHDFMSPRFFNSSSYRYLKHDKPCLRFDGDWDHDGHGVQRVFVNENEIYVERQTSYRSFDSASHKVFKKTPNSIEEIEYWLDLLVKKYK